MTVPPAQCVHGRTLPALDGLRAVAALLVVGYHVALTTWPLDVGWAGVPVFFVLSGYLITRLSLADEAGEGFSFRAFWIRRLTRIVPLYALTLGAFMVLPFVGHDGGGWTEVARVLPYYATFNGEYVHGPMTIAWSLGVEEKFYLAWPVLAFALLARTRWRLQITAVAAVSCLVLAPLTDVPYLAGYAALLVGAAAALAERQRGWVDGRVAAPVRCARAGWLTGAVVIAVVLLANVVPDENWTYVALCAPVALLVLHLVHGRSGLSRLLATWPMRWLGRRSYGIYLVHTLALPVALRLVPAEAHGRTAWVGLGCLALTLLVSDVAHRVVETPFIRWGRRWSGRTRPVRAPLSVGDVIPERPASRRVLVCGAARGPAGGVVRNGFLRDAPHPLGPHTVPVEE